MSWFKVDDKLHGNPKRLIASTAAMGLWVCAGSWSRDKHTGGYVPREALRVIAPDLTFDEACALADELVTSRIDGLHANGFWIPIANGWQFHDWESMQPEDDLEAQRRETIRTMRRDAGLRGAQARWHIDGKVDSKDNSKPGFANGNGQVRRIPGAPAREDPLPPPDPIRCLLDLDQQDHSNLQSSAEDLTESARVSGHESGASTSKPRAADTSPFKSEAEKAVFDCWATVLWPLAHKSQRPMASADRMSRIRARLRDGYSDAQLCEVVRRVAKSRFHLGENDRGIPYIEPKTIFKNATTVDDWLAEKSGTSAPDPKAIAAAAARDAAQVERLRAEARAASTPPSGPVQRELGALLAGIGNPQART